MGRDDWRTGLRSVWKSISPSRAFRRKAMGWNHRTLAFKKEMVVLGTEATEWNSSCRDRLERARRNSENQFRQSGPRPVQAILKMAADEHDVSLAQKRLNEAPEFAGHVEAVAQLHLDSRKSEALWLMTSKSTARSLDFDAKVVNSKKMTPLAETLEAK